MELKPEGHPQKLGNDVSERSHVEMTAEDNVRFVLKSDPEGVERVEEPVVNGPVLPHFRRLLSIIRVRREARYDPDGLDGVVVGERGREIAIELSNSAVTAIRVGHKSQNSHAANANRSATTCDQRRAHGHVASLSSGTWRQRFSVSCSCSHCGMGVVKPVFAR